MDKKDNKKEAYYCFVNFIDLKARNIQDGYDFDIIQEAYKMGIPEKYHKLVMKVKSDKFPSLFNSAYDDLTEWTTNHSFTIEKAKINKKDNNIYIKNVTSCLFGSNISFDFYFERKKANDIGPYMDELIESIYYTDYKLLIRKIFNLNLLEYDKDSDLTLVRSNRIKKETNRSLYY